MTIMENEGKLERCVRKDGEPYLGNDQSKGSESVHMNTSNRWNLGALACRAWSEEDLARHPRSNCLFTGFGLDQGLGA